MRLLAAVFLLTLCGPVAGETLYVDNRNGSDAADGRFPFPMSTRSGPTKTIARALQLAHPGDGLFLTQTPEPYRESIVLAGARTSGSKTIQTVIDGNGCTITGLGAVDPASWRTEDNNLWRIAFRRKGHYVILREGQLLPEFVGEPGALPAGSWQSVRGEVLYRPASADPPSREQFNFAAKRVGISMYGTSHVIIRNLTVEHFQVDGFHAQDKCRGIVLENVDFRENGRAGVAVTGVSEVAVRRCRIARNGRHSVLQTRLAQVALEENEWDAEPTLIREQGLDQ